MKAIFLDVEKGKFPEVVDIEPENDVITKMLDCEYLDFAYLDIEGKKFTFAVDDVGLYKVAPKPAVIEAIEKDGNIEYDVRLVGNVLIFGYPTFEGDLTALTTEDCKLLIKHAIHVIKKENEAQNCALLI